MLSKIILSILVFFMTSVLAKDNKISSEVANKLSNINFEKAKNLFNHIGKKPPKNFYNCLCKQNPTGSASVYYHPAPLNHSPACKETGAPCVRVGYGCTRVGFPKNKEAWESCNANSKYDDGSSVVDVLIEVAKAKAKINKREKFKNRIDSEVDNFHLESRRYLTELGMKGIKVSKYEKMNYIMRKRIMRLQPNEELPSFLQSLGFSQRDSREKFLTDVMKRKMLLAYDKNYLNSLKNGDLTWLNGMRKRINALGRFDDALVDQSQADEQMIKANQEQTQGIITSVPILGDGFDLIAIGTGETLSGEKLSGFEKVFTAVTMIAPEALTHLIGKSPKTTKALENIAGSFYVASKSAKEAMADSLNISVKKLQDFAQKIKVSKAKALTKQIEELTDTTDEVLKIYKKTTKGIEADKIWKKAKQTSSNKVENMKNIFDQYGPDSKMFRSASLEIQQDKLAQNLLINGVDKDKYELLPSYLKNKIDIETFEALNKGMKSQMKKIYKNVDRKVTSELIFDPDVMKLAKKHKLDNVRYADFEIRVKTITNKKKKPSFEIGRDNDKTYELVGKSRDGQKVVVDIDHEIAEKYYANKFYEELRGKKPTWKNKEEMKKFLEDFDQTVTSKSHLEAYNVKDLDKYLDEDELAQVIHADDISDAFLFKSTEWVDKAKKATNEADKMKFYAEAMRQSVKQWDSKGTKAFNAYIKSNPNLIKNPVIEKSLDIFRKVESLKYNPKEAMEMLKSLPGANDMETLFDKIRTNYQSLEKNASKAYWLSTQK